MTNWRLLNLSLITGCYVGTSSLLCCSGLMSLLWCWDPILLGRGGGRVRRAFASEIAVISATTHDSGTNLFTPLPFLRVSLKKISRLQNSIMNYVTICIQFGNMKKILFIVYGYMYIKESWKTKFRVMTGSGESRRGTGKIRYIGGLQLYSLWFICLGIWNKHGCILKSNKNEQ